MKQNKHKSKNLSIGSRIAIATATAIVVALAIIAILSSFFRFFTPSFYNFSSVTTNNYSLLNQIQWSQTMMNITDQLASDNSESAKQQILRDITKDFEKLDTNIYIEKNGQHYFSNIGKNDIFAQAQKICKTDLDNSINYYGDNGLVIVNKLEARNDQYKIIVSNSKYTVKPTAENNRSQGIIRLIFSKLGFVIGMIILIFILSIIIMSLITSKTITKPISLLAKGANEIASGNLDYKIDYDSTNEVGTTVTAMNDMTSKLKESIDQRNKIDKSRKEMVAGLAHDLRTPLTSVKGYVEGIRDGIAKTPEKQAEYIDIIYSSTLDMEKLLDDLMSISRLELGNIQLNLEKTNLISFIDEYTEELLPQLEQKGVKLQITKPEEQNVFVMLDTDRFSRVLNNIVSNSLKYSKKEAKTNIELSIQNYEKSVIISIEDNGIGIESENLSNIFDTFYRADTARTKAREGSGIGLAVCKEIVNLHGGTIWANSTIGEGTTILISLETLKEEQ